MTLIELTHEDIINMEPDLWLFLYHAQVGAWQSQPCPQTVLIPVEDAAAVEFWLRFRPVA